MKKLSMNNLKFKTYIEKHVHNNVYNLDKNCYDNFYMSEDLLMEHAALALKKEIVLHKKAKKILIIAGAGNNGADGIALARLLDIDGYKVKLFLPFGAKSKMARIQLKRAKALKIKIVSKIKKCDLIVDALFGSGLNRDLNSDAISIINSINKFKKTIISCDMPSGLKENGEYDYIVKANITITMGAAKTALFYDHIKPYVGKIKIANLGISNKKYSKESDIYLLDFNDLKLPYRKNKNVHKGDFGHLNIISGDIKGASVISALSALNFGAGLVTVISKNSILNLPIELMSSKNISKNSNCIAFGMGLGGSYNKNEILEIIKDKNIVVDADIFSKPIIKDILQHNKHIILTPHPKEFASMMNILQIKNISTNEVIKNKFNLSKLFSKKYPNIVLVLKGANTIIAYQNRLYIASHGKQNLAKGGSGDVLAGMIASLLTQKYSPLDAAISGVLAHQKISSKFKAKDYSLTPIKLIKVLQQIHNS